jgi:tRNA threonylcarbamoyladenosine biosynthesis protein TsaB
MLKNFLTIDTSTDVLYVSLVTDQTVVFSHQEKGYQDHAIKLMPTIIRAFEESQFSPKDLEAIVVGEGPGSYTGIRMGVVVSKMLALEWNIPLYKVSSLLLMASSYQGEVVALMDARRDHVFSAGYHLTDPIQVFLEPTYLPKKVILEKYPKATFVDTMQPDILSLKNKKAFQKVDDVSGFTPLYLRKTQAENEL